MKEKPALRLKEALSSLAIAIVFFTPITLAMWLGFMPIEGLLSIGIGALIGIALCAYAVRTRATLPRMLSPFIAVRASHILSGFLIVTFALLFGQIATIVLAVSILLSFTIFAYVTQIKHLKAPAITNIPATLWGIEAFKEKIIYRSILGAVGVILVLVFFQLWIAVSAITIFFLGDPIAAIVGRKIGKNPIPLNRQKTVEGTLSGMAASILGLALLSQILPLSFLKIIVGSFVGMIVEVLSPANDNLTVPVASAIALRAMLPL